MISFPNHYLALCCSLGRDDLLFFYVHFQSINAKVHFFYIWLTGRTTSVFPPFSIAATHT